MCVTIFSLFYIIKNVLFIITFYEAGCFLFAIDLLSIFAAE